MFLPFGTLLLWSIVLLGFGVFVFGGWQFDRWRDGVGGDTALVLAIASLLIAASGRWIALGLLGRGGPAYPRRTDGDRRLKTSDGVDLYVEDSGGRDAPTAVFLHGWGQDAGEWRRVRDRLGEGWRTIAYDLRGHSHSGSSLAHDFSVARYARDLDDVLAALRVERPVIVGHSFGGMTMLEALSSQQRHVAEAGAFVLVGTTAKPPLESCAGAGLMKALEWPLVRPLLHLMVWLSPVVWLGQWLGYLNGTAHLASFLSGFGRRPVRSVLDHATRTSVSQSPAVLARGALCMLRYDAREALDAHAMPWWVVTGDRDRVTRHDLNVAMAAASDATLMAVEGSGHMTPLENPGDVVRAIEQAAAAVSRPAKRRSG